MWISGVVRPPYDGSDHGICSYGILFPGRYTSLRRAWSETRMSEFSDLGEMITELQGRMLWKEQQPPSDES